MRFLVVLATLVCVALATFDADQCMAVTCGSSLLDSTTDVANHVGFSSKDMLLHLTLAADSRVFLDTCGSDFDTVVRVYDSAATTELGWCDDCGTCGTSAQFEIDLVAGEYVVVVEGYASTSGTFNLTTTCTSLPIAIVPTPTPTACSVSPTPEPTYCDSSAQLALVMSLVGEGSGYDSTSRPGLALNAGKKDVEIAPDNVDTQIHITHIGEVSTKEQRMIVYGYIRFLWNDPRLKFNDTNNGGCSDLITLEERHWDMLWRPDVYIENQVGEILITAEGLYMYPDGLQFMSQKFIVDLSCAMVFDDFPFDSQDCHLELSTYTKSGNELWLRFWGGVSLELSPNLQHTEYFISLGSSNEDDIITRHFLNGTTPWRYTFHKFILQRKTEFFKKYIGASVMIAFVAYMGFWVDRRVAPARVAITLIPLLSLLTLFFGMAILLPRSEKMSWIESYMFGSLTWTVYTCLEYPIVSYLLQREALNAKKKQEEAADKKKKAEDEKSKREIELVKRESVRAITMVDGSGKSVEGSWGDLLGPNGSNEDDDVPVVATKPAEAPSGCMHWISSSLAREWNYTCNAPWSLKLDIFSRVFHFVSYMIYIMAMDAALPKKYAEVGDQ